MELGRPQIEAALAGDKDAIRAFVVALTPIIHARVLRVLVHRGRPTGRDARQDVEDMAQDVFAALFAHDGRVLRSWSPALGLSLANFVGLVAERQVASILRSGRRSPWRDTPEELDTLEAATSETAKGPEVQIESRRTLDRLLDRMRASLSVRGLELFQRLYVDEEPIDDVATRMNMTKPAIYAWRNRVTHLLRTFAAEIDGDELDPGASPRIPKEPANDD